MTSWWYGVIVAVMAQPHEVLLWVDVETTGLDPHADQLLEVAAVATTLDEKFDTLGEPFSRVVGLPRTLTFHRVAPEVIEMHAASRLWREALASKLSADQAAQAMYHWARSLELWNGPTVYFAGRSVHFDRRWIEAHLYEGLRFLNISHRHFDLTAIKAFATVAELSFSVPEEKHRALDDVLDDIELARSLVGMIRRRGID